MAYGDESLEYKIKAAYLYNFTKFITWPENHATTFNICIVGGDPFRKLLDNLESKTAFDKPIRVFRYAHIKQAKDCHIAYFDKIEDVTSISAPNSLIVGALPSTLTVGSQPFFAESGGMIGFVLEQEKIKLHINLKALKLSGLEISAKLIEVSTLVKEDEHE
ncbi:YfiR family protein [Methylomonas sp. LL1]|uniref:YfiR family protein n=1 Tax=Methylomonas sp. LL1 TaxID=2785785 RepID=UPI001E30959D|nr:YfiR family protein [Methylomonas sp. LL1]